MEKIIAAMPKRAFLFRLILAALLAGAGPGAKADFAEGFAAYEEQPVLKKLKALSDTLVDIDKNSHTVSFNHYHQQIKEVVVFEADSLENLKQTHSRYFVEREKDLDTTDTVIAVGLVTLALSLLTKES